MMTINPTTQWTAPTIADERTIKFDVQIASLRDCRAYLENIIEQISGTRVRRIVGTAFQDLLRLLECLSIIESHLRHVQTAEETLAFFQIIRDEVRSLIEFIRADALNCDEVSGDLADTLDGLAFALSHDLRRVFEGEDENAPEGSAYVVLGRIHRAHDVLTNCLQQSTISLALVFNPDLSVAQLFNNMQRRYQQSLKLCSDLERLRATVQELVEGNVTCRDLGIRLDTFRRESLEFLMYSDWPQFESFCERINASAEDPSTFPDILHQFLCYLETLLRQVRMRAVLADESTPRDTEISPEASPFVFKELPLHAKTDNLWPEFAFSV